MTNKTFKPTDVASRKAADAKREHIKSLEYKQYEADFAWLMEHKQGRRFMWQLLAKTGVFQNPFTGDSKTFFKCGEMNVGQRFLNDITAICPHRFVQMLNDNQEVTAHVR